MESTNKNNSSPNSLSLQEQDKGNKELLVQFIKSSQYIVREDQPLVCERFGMPFIKVLFAREYRRRFYDLLKKEPITCAKASKLTGIPQKYLCTVKTDFESKNKLWVTHYGFCDVGRSEGVQFISTDEKYKPKFIPTKESGSNQMPIDFSSHD